MIRAAKLLVLCWGVLACCLAAVSPAIAEFSEKPLAVEAVRAFDQLKFRRPIVLTHAGDGSDRVFVAEQRGPVYVFPNKADVAEPTLFLDLEPKVTYKDTENEEGLLGMAFHPNYKENGQFFIYYTSREAAHLSVISRFRVSKNDPNKADAEFEEELLRIPQPFWNHNGGTLAFGPDSMLYITLGDGGKANDPLKQGQDKSTLLGKVLRIDVDHHDQGKNYAIPQANPFVGEEGARGEIWAYGFRNPWRHTFDRQTGALWLGDVGQDKWEEIDLVVKGGNYGWNIREGLHNFAGTTEETPKDMIDPIWEYHHNVGKSITGGNVYRGRQVPALAGKYLYGDYVGKQIWALDYDMAAKKVVANYRLGGGENPPLDIVSFGEDQSGEVYLLESLGRIFKFRPTK